MRNYSRDDDQDDEDYFKGFEDDNDDEVSDDEMEAMMDEEELPSSYVRVKMAELSLVEANLNRRILVGVVKTLEKGILWRFLPHHTKLKMIAETYQWYSRLIGD